MKIPSMKFFVYGLFLSALAYIAGCGTGQYEERMNKWVRDHQADTKFKNLAEYVTVPGTQIKIRLPKKLVQDGKDITTDFALLTEGTANEKRLKIPGIEFPGWKATYEALITDGDGNKSPYYIYIGELQNMDNPGQKIKNSLGDKVQNVVLDEAFTGESAEGFVDWKRLHATATTDFAYIDPKGKETYQTRKCVLEILYRTSGTKLFLLGWRAPEDFVNKEDYIKVKEWLPLVAGSMTDTD
jgi:hypothetical protein